jgi:flagellar hook assembly protein FlgD
VYIGYTGGLITYRSTTSPAQSDYSAVLAYPNPVRPDYTGYITVSGLMENSLVKIADASGNVVFQTRSSGGMAVWDGCNADGSRVNTGVYFVLASQNENDNATSVVTKILVVK